MNLEKLTDFIRICLQNKNYHAIIDKVLTLIHNEAQRIGITLGIRPLDMKEELVSDYLEKVNSFVNKNLKIQLLDQDLIDDLRIIEKAHILENDTEQSAKDALGVYYDLRVIHVPNVFQINEGIQDGSSFTEASLLSLLNPTNKTKKGGSGDQISDLLRSRIQQKQRTLQKSPVNTVTLQKAFELKSLSDSLQNKNHKKVVEGSLTSNLSYQNDLSQLFIFAVYGVAVLLLGLGIMTSLCAAILPQSAGVSTVFALLFLISGIAIFPIVKYQV